MYIRTTNEASRRLYDQEILDGSIEFDDDRIARVTADEGEALIERYDDLELEDDEGTAGDGDDDEDDDPDEEADDVALLDPGEPTETNT